ncbi:MAG: ABC transporter ATP-binding protein [Acidimicrobiales bacterium]
MGLHEARGGDASVASGGLEIEELTVRFGGLLALDGVSLTVAPHEIVGLIGPNGAGKTTLFNAVSGFVRPTRGVIRWQGRPLRRHEPHHLGRLGIARTLQGVGLCKGLSAVENVACGAHPLLRADLGSAFGGLWRSSREERRITARAEALLGELGVADWGNRLPGALPYGVQKRVALARALIGEPSLLLLDEPMSGLSTAEMDDLSSRIRGLREHVAVLLVEHRMDFVMATCDRIVVLNFGEVVMSGTPDEVRASPEVTEAYLGEAVHSPEGPDPVGNPEDGHMQDRPPADIRPGAPPMGEGPSDAPG